MKNEMIGKKLKLARLEAGLTQKGVAMRIQRPQQTIAAWEVGRSQPDLDTFAELLRLYGISADTFLGCDQKSLPQLTRKEGDWVRQYRGLDEHGKELVDAVLSIEFARMEHSKTALVAARGGGLSAVNQAAAAAANGEFVQASEDLNL